MLDSTSALFPGTVNPVSVHIEYRDGCVCCRDIDCQAVVFAPPACAAKKLAAECRDYVTSVVVADDIITRFSPAALARLHGSLADMSPEEIHEVQL